MTLYGISFSYPWMLALPILFAALRLIFLTKALSVFTRKSSHSHPRYVVPFPSSIPLSELPKSVRIIIRTPTLLALSAVTITFFSLAAARPHRVSIMQQSEKGRNIALVLDTSRSMQGEDFPTPFGTVSRMDGVKSVVAEYVRSRIQDRVGLVVFGQTGYLQSPLTSDVTLVEELVRDLRPGMAGDGTAIGDGMGLGIKMLEGVATGTRAMILLTDGVNNSGSVSPIKAAQMAKEFGIPVHTIGIGVGTTPLSSSLFGLSLGPAAEFDEKTLKEVAAITGGVYFNAENLDGLQHVYREIDRLTESESDDMSKTVNEELFVPFAGIGCLVYLMLLLLATTVFQKVP